jgi:hypothetical protein
MNENQETEITIRLPWLLLMSTILVIASSVIAYKAGKGQAYKDIVRSCIENKVSAGICFLDSKDSVDNVIQIVNEVLEEETSEDAREEVDMLLNQKKV